MPQQRGAGPVRWRQEDGGIRGKTVGGEQEQGGRQQKGGVEAVPSGEQLERQGRGVGHQAQETSGALVERCSAELSGAELTVAKVACCNVSWSEIWEGL